MLGILEPVTQKINKHIENFKKIIKLEHPAACFLMFFMMQMFKFLVKQQQAENTRELKVVKTLGTSNAVGNFY